MLILGIETSCDETAAAVVSDGRTVLSNVVSSQIAMHRPFGGVVPEIASRQHVRVITEVTEEALHRARVSYTELDAVAATRGPGLAGALLVGYNFARGLAFGRALPLIAVNHLEGHLYSAWLAESTESGVEPQLPLLALIVSGGHTELVLVRAHGDYELLGRTLDDAAGEAFDKVARLLGLGYPGGPAIQQVAGAATAPVALPRAWLPGSHDFSFSGLKTAVLHAVRAASAERRGLRSEERAGHVDAPAELSDKEIADIAAGFQESVVDVLTAKTRTAAAASGARSVALVGGVAANSALRSRMQSRLDLPLFISPHAYSTDNAAMIAAAAYFAPGGADSDIEPGLALSSR